MSLSIGTLNLGDILNNVKLPPLRVIGNSSFTMKAADVKRLAEATMMWITTKRQQDVRSVIKDIMAEQHDHKFLGYIYYRHDKWPSVEVAMEHHPMLQMIKNNGEGSVQSCKNLIAMANYLIYTSGLPEDMQLMMISATDFKAINQANEHATP